MSKEDLDLDNDSFDDEPEDGDASGSDNSAPPEDGAAGNDKDEKRVNDLMSNWQKEQARANRLEAELKALKSGSAGDQKDETPAGGGTQSAQPNEFEEFVREDARRRIFESDPRLAEYGLDVASIAGSSIAEMKASLAAQQKLVDGVETRARQRALTEFGLDPEVRAADREKPLGIAEMSEEEFEKFLAQRDARRFG